MDERIKRTKDKLRVYGNDTRQIRQLERRLQQIEDAIAWHQDWPEQAAKAVSYTHLDVYKRQGCASGLSDPI